MAPENQENLLSRDFLFESKLSFTNLIGFWQVRTNDPNPFISASAKEVIKRVEEVPEFLAPITDLSLLEKHPDIVQLIMSAVFPPALSEDDITTVMVPFAPIDVYSTRAHKNLMAIAGSYDAFMTEPERREMVSKKVMTAYAAIMQMFYGITLQLDRNIVYTLKSPKTGLSRFYRVDINPKFCEINLKGELPQLSDEDIKYLIDHLYDLDIWMKYLPSEIFEFQGFVIFTLTDITSQEILSRIKEKLLQRNSIVNQDGFQQLERKFQSLLQLSDLKLGIASYQKGKNSFINFGKQICRSILMGEENGIACSATNASLHEKFENNREPYIIEDLATHDMGGYEQKLMSEGVRNIILSPLFFNGEFVGLLELASPNPGDLNSLALTKIKDVLPLFAVAVKRSSEEFENSIQSIIKEKYTSIHPTVEWKFVDAAYDIIEQQIKGDNPIPKPIVFKDVYPLYAATDIRNSSVERNKAINTDLKEQLHGIRNLLQLAQGYTNLPILDEIVFRLDAYHKKIKKRLVSGDEVTIVEFIQNEVEPVMRNLEQNNAEFANDAKDYWESLDPEFGVIYNCRKAFENSLTKINEVVGKILDDEEEKAQEMFPHFFEKYKTDGVEHNIYVGASLVQKMNFDPIYLKNLRLWQLIVTAEIAREAAALVPKLELPLETTHLILVHSAPLSIRFRMDEKQFDVDGAYNIRYEIIKKRIDKSLIKGTNERVTQPGKIAIIYSQEKDAREYIKYINYLQNKKLLASKVEELELEELQGVSGLRALRVQVNSDAPSFMDEIRNILEIAE